MDNYPHFIGVDEILRHNTDVTKSLLNKELEIRLSELEEAWHYTSLEKIFFEQRVYKILEDKAESWDDQLDAVETELKKYESQLRKEVVHDDVLRLVEKPVRKISSFDIKQLDISIKNIESEEKTVKHNLDHLVDYTIQYFSQLKKKYGSKYPRKTEICNFETIEATRVVVANAKLYANRLRFVGWTLRGTKQNSL
jgi:topoisomerase-4 subunit A